MSHITRVMTKMTDIITVARALAFLQIPCTINNDVVTIPTKNTYNVTIFKRNDTIQLQADYIAWDSLANYETIRKYYSKQKYPRITQERFAGVLQQAYNVVRAQEQAVALGHTMEISEPDTDGIIHARIMVGESSA